MSSSHYTSKNVYHHGLVAGFCQEIGLATIIDNALGLSEHRQVSYGQLFMAMMLNGLCFTGRTVHMYSEYVQDKPLDRLIGEGVCAEQLMITL